MAINFPSPATPNQTHTHNGLTWKYDGTTWILQTTMQSGATSFVNLTDTPSSYSGQAGKWIKVNSTPDGLEFTDEPTGSDTTYELKTNLVSSNVNLKLDAAGAGTDDNVLITAGSNITFSQVSEDGFTITASSGTATISDGDYGDITVSSSGSVWSIDDNTVGPDELKDTSVSAGTYTNPSITVDAQGRLTSATTGSATPLTLGASVADILDLPSTTLNADDPGADRIVFWDDSSGKLTHLSLGTNLSISGTVLNASAGAGDGDTTYDLITSSSGSNVVLTLDASAGDDDPITITAGNNITLTENGSGTGFTITSTASGGSGPSTEEIQDIVGAMFSNNTETRITATYQDGDGTIDLVVQDMTSTGSDTTYDFYCSGSSNPVLRLDPSTGSNDDVTIKGGTDITVTRNSNSELEIAYTGSGGGGTPAGGDHDIQYNNNGSMAGAARLHYHDGDNTLDFLHSDGTQKGRYYVTGSGEHAIWTNTWSPNSYSQGVAQLFKSDGIWFPGKLYSYETSVNPQNYGVLGEYLGSGGSTGSWDWIPQFLLDVHGKVNVYGPGSHTYTPDLTKYQYFIIMLTGGGGAGGEGGSNAGGGGGGSGGTSIQAGGQMMLGASASASISVGSGGAASSSGNGNNGGNSTVSTNGGGTYYMTALGGGGGIGNQTSINGGGFGGGCSCSNSTSVLANGAFGGVGHSANYLRGFGGPSFWGGPDGSNFSIKGAPGSGGTGSQNGSASQPGGDGCCVIIEF